MIAAILVILATLTASASAFPFWPLTPFDMAPPRIWTWPSASSLVESAIAETEALEERRVELEKNKNALDETLALLKETAPDALGTTLVEDMVGEKLRCIGLEEETLDRLLGGRKRLLEAIHKDDNNNNNNNSLIEKDEEEVVVE